jgi:hypothetical protein
MRIIGIYPPFKIYRYLLPLFLLFLPLSAILLAGCQLSPATLTAIPNATQTLSTPIPTARTGSATAALTTTPDLRVRGTQTQTAWTATFQAFTQEAHAQETEVRAQEPKNVENNATLDAQYWVTSTAVVDTLRTTVTPQVYHSYRSPDGKWLAKIILYPCTQVRTEPGYRPDALEVLQMNDQEVETEDYFCGGQGAYGFAGKFWTYNSRFFYYTDAREGWPDGGYPWRRPISRFDTVTGKSETLGYAVFSPGQTRIAGAQGMDLVIWDINGDTVHRFFGMPTDHPPYGIVWAAWSPDGHRLAYVTETFCQDASSCPATLFLVNTQTWQQMQLLGPSDPRMMTVEWNGPNTLSLWGADFRSTWLFDLTKNALTQVLSIPTITLLPNRTPKP